MMNTDELMKLADSYACDLVDERNDTSTNPKQAIDKVIASRDALKSALEAMQADSQQLQRDFTYMKQQRDAYQQAADKMAAEHKAERDALQAENKRLQIENESFNYSLLSAANRKLREDNNALQAKLTELQKQEPIYQCMRGDGCWFDQTKTSYDYNLKYGASEVRIVYTSPKALEPLTDARIELVTTIHTLASHYENRLHRLDADDRKLAEGDIAYAMKIAAKWNWNGIGGQPT